jgi:hypothetical protein
MPSNHEYLNIIPSEAGLYNCYAFRVGFYRFYAFKAGLYMKMPSHEDYDLKISWPQWKGAQV